MAAKLILVLCAQAFFVQSAFSQCLGRGAIAPALIAPATAVPGCGSSAWGVPAWGASGLAAPGWAGANWAAPAIEIVPTSGGALPVSSYSPIAPVGISLESENVFEGILTAAGELPFVGTVAVEGVLPTTGAGVVNHACGDGHTRMVSDGAGVGSLAGAYGAGIGAYGYGAGAYGAGLGGIAPLSVGAGCNGPAVTRGCACGGLY